MDDKAETLVIVQSRIERALQIRVESEELRVEMISFFSKRLLLLIDDINLNSTLSTLNSFADIMCPLYQDD